MQRPVNTMKKQFQQALALFALLAGVGQASAQTNAFTYQGRLMDNGQPATVTYDFQFALYNAASSGALVAGTVTNEDVSVSNGLFTVMLDFGGGVFTGADRWLAIGVRPGTNTGSFTALAPRQALTPVPYARYALTPAGPQGPPVSFQGTWSNLTTYSTGDTVFFNGSSYISLSNGNVGNAPSNGAPWA